MVGMETRGSVTTIRCLGKILAIIVVQQTREITLGIIVGGIAGSGDYLDGSIEFLRTEEREHILLLTRDIVVLVLIVLMTQHGCQGVLAYLLAVVDDLLEVDRIGLVSRLGDVTARIGDGSVSVERLDGLRLFPLIIGNRTIERYLQALDRRNINITIEREHIGEGMIGVQLIRLQEVTHRIQGARTLSTTILTRTIVIHLAILIHHDVAIAITHIDRIDRGKASGEAEDRLATLGHIVLVGMRKVDIGTHLEPVLGLVICLDACGISLEIRVIDDTLVLQIAQGSIVSHLVAAARHAHVVFLAQGMAESLILPVVRHQGIKLSVVIHTIAQGGVRVQSSIGTDEVFPIRHGIDKIAQATLVARGADGIVGIDMGIVSRQAPIAYIIIIKSLVISFIVLSRTRDAIIVDIATAIGTPLGIEGDRSLLRLALLGGDHDDSVGTTSTIECVAGSILQHGDALHIIRVEVVPSALVRCTIHDDKRRSAGIDRTEATDGKGRIGGRRT